MFVLGWPRYKRGISNQYVRRKKSQERGLLQDEKRYLQLAQFMPVLLLPVGAGAVPPDLDLEGEQK